MYDQLYITEAITQVMWERLEESKEEEDVLKIQLRA